MLHRFNLDRRLIVRATCVALALVAWVIGNFAYKPRQPVVSHMEIAPSIPAQLAASFGDRYLAANVNVWRSVVAEGVALPEYALQTLRRLQVDAAWLNPAHEDNYYTANAVLPWEGFVGEAQYILEAATRARRDTLPPFFLAFNEYYFLGDVDKAVFYLRVAAKMAQEPGEPEAFIEMAERWKRQGDDVSASIGIIKKTMGRSGNKKVALLVAQRLKRLEGLGILRAAAARYLAERKTAPASVADLVAAGYVDRLPEDPTGLGYAMAHERVVLAGRETSYRMLWESNQ